MTMIAYEAHQILVKIDERIAFHEYQRDKWDAEFERKCREVNPGPGLRVNDAHYEHARFYEHVHALLELYRVRGLVQREIATADLRVQFEHRGYTDGRSAGSWIVGNQQEAQKLVNGIMNGDPEIMDELPSPRLGGEFADDSTWTDIYVEITGIDPQDFEDDDPNNSDMYDAYTGKFGEGVQDQIFSDAAKLGVEKVQS